MDLVGKQRIEARLYVGVSLFLYLIYADIYTPLNIALYIHSPIHRTHRDIWRDMGKVDMEI